MNKNSLAFILLHSSCALLLSACGGSSSSSDSNTSEAQDSETAIETTSTISAFVTKGPVDGATCNLYSITNAGVAGSLLGASSSTAGAVSFSVNSTEGSAENYLIECSGGTYTDESTGATMTAPQLRAVVEISANVSITVSPLTEMAVALASDLLSVDYELVAEAFGLGDVDVLTTAPTDLNTESAADNDAGDYGTVLALVSQYQADEGVSLQQTMNSLVLELGDGVLNQTVQDALSSAATNLDSSAVVANLNSGVVDDLVAAIQQVESNNSAPVAEAGADFSAPTGSSIVLDGSASTDDDNDSLEFSWNITSQPDGSGASLANSSTSSPTFIADLDGSYVVQLSVSDGEASSVDSITVTAETKSWIINNNDAAAYIDALVNVQSVSNVQIGPNPFFQVAASGVPDYSVVVTQDQIDALNSRPKAASDFDGGQTSLQAGDSVQFGQDIGYNITKQGCELGYWPPGPACPTDQQREARIPSSPSPAQSECETSTNTMGLMLNGTSLYNWSDGVSYNNESTWRQLAPEFEIYDVDICSGHAQTQGDYHHHMFSPCLAELFGDSGQAHSPIYGYAADGYPVYGPYHAKDVLARSAWVKRDYSDTNAGGCGDGARSCLLVNQYDLSEGIVSTNYPGPAVNETVTSNSGNSFVAESGLYFEDYYYDASLTALGNEYLDEHNGHSHDDLGYHYHTTVEEADGDLIPVFPYNIGPTFYGETPGGSLYTCAQLP